MKETVLNEIKELGKEMNFQVVKTYNDKYFRSGNALHDKFLFRGIEGQLKKTKAFIMQKFGKTFGKMLYRY